MAGKCRTVRKEIETADDRAALMLGAQSHLDACAECSILFAENGRVRQLVSELERVEAPGDFDFRLRARIASMTGSPSGRRWPRFSLPLTAGLVATCVSVMFGISFVVSSYTRQPSTEDIAATAQPSLPVASPIDVIETSKDTTATTEQSTPSDHGAAVRAPNKANHRAGQRASVLRVASRGRTQSEAIDFGFRGNQVFSGPNVGLKVSAEPLSVVVRDENGVARRLVMRPVSFGAQNLVGRARELPSASTGDQEGVW
jgi:hypothetical protein